MNETPEFQRYSREFAAAVRPIRVIVAQKYVHMESLQSLAYPHGLAGAAVLKMRGIAA